MSRQPRARGTTSRELLRKAGPSTRWLARLVGEDSDILHLPKAMCYSLYRVACDAREGLGHIAGNRQGICDRIGHEERMR